MGANGECRHSNNASNHGLAAQRGEGGFELFLVFFCALVAYLIAQDQTPSQGNISATDEFVEWSARRCTSRLRPSAVG